MKRSKESEFRKGVRVVTTEIPSDYTPPSASMNPAATVEPTRGPKGPSGISQADRCTCNTCPTCGKPR